MYLMCMMLYVCEGEGALYCWYCHQVIIQYGGDVVEKYDSLKVTHLLALHKNCPEFDMVRPFEVQSLWPSRVWSLSI